VQVKHWTAAYLLQQQDRTALLNAAAYSVIKELGIFQSLGITGGYKRLLAQDDTGSLVLGGAVHEEEVCLDVAALRQHFEQQGGAASTSTSAETTASRMGFGVGNSSSSSSNSSSGGSGSGHAAAAGDVAAQQQCAVQQQDQVTSVTFELQLQNRGGWVLPTFITQQQQQQQQERRPLFQRPNEQQEQRQQLTAQSPSPQPAGVPKRLAMALGIRGQLVLEDMPAGSADSTPEASGHVHHQTDALSAGEQEHFEHDQQQQQQQQQQGEEGSQDSEQLGIEGEDSTEEGEDAEEEREGEDAEGDEAWQGEQQYGHAGSL
jgi:hypothetical protein